MAPFARDLGYDGPPFAWDEDRRAQLRAELDALYARAYGLTRDELRYILDPADVKGPDYPSETFRVLKKNEIARFGEYRTARLVLAAYDQLSEATAARRRMIVLENPPGSVVRIEAQKAAWDNGYRLERGVEGGWLRYGSTTAPGTVWIAGASLPAAPGCSRSTIQASLPRSSDLPPSPVAGPGIATFMLATLTQLHAALDRVYKLAVSLPDAPLARFQAKTAGLPRTTEAERLVIQRIGQNVFRDALMDYWGGRCPLTGITEPGLLRASHIVPWSDCDDAQRLDVHNGLLLSALWDAAFDQGLVSFADDGSRAPVPSSARLRARLWALTQRRRFAAFGTRIAPIYHCIERATASDSNHGFELAGLQQPCKLG